MPLFSVIIPTYNRSKLVQRAVKSVLNQSFTDFELIVIDDGSTDDTDLVLKNLPINYFKTENKGVGHARNYGISHSSGKWICFLDSDDEWAIDKLKIQKQHIDTYSKIEFFHTDEKWIRDGKQLKVHKKYDKSVSDIFYRSLSHCIISTGTVCMSRSLLSHLNGFDEELIVCEDYDLWLRAMSEYQAHHIDKELTTKYAGHGDQLSFTHKAMDYYRVVSLDKLIKNKNLKMEIREKAKEELLKKCSILLRGFEKYSNPQKEKRIKSILEDYIS